VSRVLTFALPKGRLLEGSLRRLREVGVEPQAAADRALVVPSRRADLRFLFLKDADVPLYVARGAADLAVVGSDQLRESAVDLAEPLRLEFGECRLALAAAEGTTLASLRGRAAVRVATKYPRLAAQALAERGIAAELLRLSGSVEIAPVIGLADAIFDLVETGRTLVAHKLCVIDEVMVCGARLVVNRAAFRLEGARLGPLLDDLRAADARLKGDA
jgi:ATP phosphoribosyltransferase